MAKFCTECGHALTEETTVCPECGTRVQNSANPSPEKKTEAQKAIPTENRQAERYAPNAALPIVPASSSAQNAVPVARNPLRKQTRHP